MFAKRYYYRPSLRRRMPPHSKRRDYQATNSQHAKDDPDESNFPQVPK
jgi:hypothetical protein